MANPADIPEIQKAYDEVRDDKNETNWLLINYEDAKSDKLFLKASGSGGLDDLKTHFDANEAQYAYVRVEYANDTESKRVKFAFIVWIGEKCKVMRKAKVSIQSGQVRKVLSHHSITVDARDMSDLSEREIIVRLRKAGGADYDNQRRA